MFLKRMVSVWLSLALVTLMPSAAHASEQKPINLWVSQTDTPDPVVENGFVTYTITVGNKIPQPANKVHVAFSLSAGKYIGASGHSWACTVNGLSGYCDHSGAIPALTNSDPITLIAQAPSAQTAAEITNTAVVSTADPDYAELDPSDNTWVETTTIKGGTDVAIDQVDEPDPVTAGNTVRYVITANNNSDTTTATGVKVTGTVSSGTITRARGTGWTCTLSAGAQTASCSYGSGIVKNTPAPTLELLVLTTSSTVTSTMTDTATISAANGDANKNNNTDVESTKVLAGNNGVGTGYVPPEGGQVTTCSAGSPSTSDTTCATVTLPAGPGGVVTLEEGDPIAICQSSGCAGNSINVIVPDGYNPNSTTNPTNPILVTIFIDSASISGASNDSTRTVYVEKEAGVQAVSLPSCSARVPGLPCVRSQTRTDSTSLSGPNDYIGTIEMFSGDPIFDTGDTVNKITQ